MSIYDNSDNEILNDLEVKQEKTTEFWGNDPNILLKGDYLYQLFPTEDMTYNEKLNSVTRLVLLLTIISVLISKSVRIFFIGIFSVILIYVIHFYNNKMIKENFDAEIVAEIVEENDLNNNVDEVFEQPNSKNPFNNVLVPDIELNPNKKPAPPAFNNDVNEKIINESKKMIQELNPDQPDISEKLFKDLGEQYTFEQSLRQFNSNPNTRVVNDQTGFAEFCYGNMVSCKEGNLFACARNKTNYNLY